MVEVADGIFTVRMPLPFQLDSVNCYLLRDTDGWFVVDTGINYALGQEIWAQSLGALGLGFSDLKRILITHFHPDHFGAAGWLQERSGAEVYMSGIDAQMPEMVWSRQGFLALGQQLIRNGVPQDLVDRMESAMMSTIEWIRPYPLLKLLAEGDRLAIAESWWEVLITPGHSPGHICLYSRQRRIIIAGDQLLPKISSNISYFPGATQNPLEDYLNSLARLKMLAIDLVLPAHGEGFNNPRERIAELLRHHEERLVLVRDAVGSGRAAFAVSQKVFGDHLNLHDIRFALGETIAHLKYLVKQGQLREEARGDLTLYFKRNH